MQNHKKWENICSINISCHGPVEPLSIQQINNFPLFILWKRGVTLLESGKARTVICRFNIFRVKYAKFVQNAQETGKYLWYLS